MDMLQDMETLVSVQSAERQQHIRPQIMDIVINIGQMQHNQNNKK